MLNLLKKFTIPKNRLIELEYYLLVIKNDLKIIDTYTLVSLYYDLMVELYSRDDFCNLDDLKITYEITKDQLKKRGVINV